MSIYLGIELYLVCGVLFAFTIETLSKSYTPTKITELERFIFIIFWPILIAIFLKNL